MFVPCTLGEDARVFDLASVGAVLVKRVVLEVVRRQAGVMSHLAERAGEIAKHFPRLHGHNLIGWQAENKRRTQEGTLGLVACRNLRTRKGDS